MKSLFWVVLEDREFNPPVRTWINGWNTEREALRERSGIVNGGLPRPTLEVIVTQEEEHIDPNDEFEG